MSLNKVSVGLKKCENYEFQNVYNSINEVIELAGGLDCVKEKGKKVLLKPNILAGADIEKAVTVHPVVIDVLIKIFKEKGFVVGVGDSPAVESFKVSAKKIGLDRIIIDNNCDFLNFKEYLELTNPSAKICKTFRIVKEFKEYDSVVSIAKLKTHSQMFYTGAIKNLFGMVCGLEKSRLHARFPDANNFAEMLVDLLYLIKPSFSFMDAVIGMEGNGPQGGDPKFMGFFGASKDPLALDCVCAELIGYKIDDIPVLKLTFDRKDYFISSIDEIEIKGERKEDLKPKSFKLVNTIYDTGFIRKRLPKFVYEFLRNLLVKRPFFNKKKCQLCLKCIAICPAKALTKVIKCKKHFIKINYDKCIRCYCCHEICPYKAIDLK